MLDVWWGLAIASTRVDMRITSAPEPTAADLLLQRFGFPTEVRTSLGFNITLNHLIISSVERGLCSSFLVHACVFL